jgi:hypothetical protein
MNAVPIEDLAEAIKDLIQQGKVKHYVRDASSSRRRGPADA